MFALRTLFRLPLTPPLARLAKGVCLWDRQPSGAVGTSGPPPAQPARLSAADCRDIGLSAEDATGVASYRPDLPFFMQPGFGRDR